MVLLVLVIGESNLTFGESRKCRLNAENWIAPLLFFCFGRSEGTSSACKWTLDTCFSKVLVDFILKCVIYDLCQWKMRHEFYLTYPFCSGSCWPITAQREADFTPLRVTLFFSQLNFEIFYFETFCVLLDFSEVCFVVMHQNFGNQKYLTVLEGRNLWPNRWHLISASVMACFDCVSVYFMY